MIIRVAVQMDPLETINIAPQIEVAKFPELVVIARNPLDSGRRGPRDDPAVLPRQVADVVIINLMPPLLR